MVLTADQDGLGRRSDWHAHFGKVTLVRGRQFGDVTKRRLRKLDGVEIEVGLAPVAWAQPHPLDSGTPRVVREGFAIVYDPDGTLARLATAVRERP